MNSDFITTVYGPVYSWRVGHSLGIDVILETSVCSFNCVYCQLGNIQVVTNERRQFVPTDQVINDFLQSRWQESDMITFSGSGEPTLATNLGLISRKLKEISALPQLVLTNGTLLNQQDVINDLQVVDKVFIKLDASDEAMFQRINRPAAGITLDSVIENILHFKQQYQGYVGLQMMFMPGFMSPLEKLCEIINCIEPDEVQLNTPKRPYAKEWDVSSRGGHTEELRHYQSVPLRTISLEEAQQIEAFIQSNTHTRVESVYKPH